MKFNKWTLGLALICALALSTLNLNAQTTVTTTNASGGTTTTTGAGAGMPAFTSVTNILGSAGAGVTQVAQDGYLVFKNFTWTNPIAVNPFGLLNGSGHYGFGLEVHQINPNQLVNIGFAVAGIQTDKVDANGNKTKGWNFYDASLNLSLSKVETIPLINLPINLRIFSGPFASLNGGVLLGAESGVSGDLDFKLSSRWAISVGGGVVNCSGAAAAGLKSAMPMAHFALCFNPVANW